MVALTIRKRKSHSILDATIELFANNPFNGTFDKSASQILDILRGLHAQQLGNI